MDTVIAALALIVAMASAVYSWRWGRRLHPIEERLKQIELEEAEERQASKEKANVVAYFEGHKRLVILNEGPAPAREVTLRVDTRGEGNPIIASELKDKLPIPLLAPGTPLALAMAPALGDARFFSVTLNWRDPEGDERTWESELSLG